MDRIRFVGRVLKRGWGVYSHPVDHIGRVLFTFGLFGLSFGLALTGQPLWVVAYVGLLLVALLLGEAAFEEWQDAVTLVGSQASKLKTFETPAVALDAQEEFYDGETFVIALIRNLSSMRLLDVQAVIKSAELVGVDGQLYEWSDFSNHDYQLCWRGYSVARRDIDGSAVLEIVYAVPNQQQAHMRLVNAQETIMTGSEFRFSIEISAANMTRLLKAVHIRFDVGNPARVTTAVE